MFISYIQYIEYIPIIFSHQVICFLLAGKVFWIFWLFSSRQKGFLDFLIVFFSRERLLIDTQLKLPFRWAGSKDKDDETALIADFLHPRIAIRSPYPKDLSLALQEQIALRSGKGNYWYLPMISYGSHSKQTMMLAKLVSMLSCGRSTLPLQHFQITRSI